MCKCNHRHSPSKRAGSWKAVKEFWDYSYKKKERLALCGLWRAAKNSKIILYYNICIIIFVPYFNLRYNTYYSAK